MAFTPVHKLCCTYYFLRITRYRDGRRWGMDLNFLDRSNEIWEAMKHNKKFLIMKTAVFVTLMFVKIVILLHDLL